MKNLNKIQVDGKVYDIYSLKNHEELVESNSNLEKKLEDESKRIQDLIKSLSNDTSSSIEQLNKDLKESIDGVNEQINKLSHWYEGN